MMASLFSLLTPAAAAIPRGETMGRRIRGCQTAVSAFPLEPTGMTSDGALLFKSRLPKESQMTSPPRNEPLQSVAEEPMAHVETSAGSLQKSFCFSRGRSNNFFVRRIPCRSQ